MKQQTDVVRLHARRWFPSGARRGFTLLELMVVLVVVSILTALAISAYTFAVRKSRRSAAQGCLTESAQYMERFYTTNMRYDQDTGGSAVSLPGCSSDVTPYYTVSFSAGPAASSFTLRAVPKGSQVKDTTCGTMTINQVGVTTPSTGCW